MSLQADFDHVWAKLTEQGVPSATPNGSCFYNGPNGTHCALGHLFTKEELETIPEGQNIFRLNDSHVLPHRFQENINFYADLQQAHDDAAVFPTQFVEDLHLNLRRVGYFYGLKVPTS
mgnify:CR=1 FL=1